MSKAIEDIADELFGDSTGSTRGGLEQLYVCPNCDKPKLSVNIETGGYRCWSQPDCENYKGKIQTLYKGEIKKGGGARLQKYRKSESGREGVQTLEEIEAVPIVEGSSEWIYLIRDRGMTPDEAREAILFYDLRRSDVWRYRLQLIVPVYDDGYSGYLRRYLVPLPNGIRYMNGKGLKRTKVLYNLDRAVDYPEVWAAEGIFSAFAFGKRGVATFGKEVTKEQARRLARTGKKIVVALDGGELLAELKTIVLLRSLGANVDRVKLPHGKDPDDLKLCGALSGIIDSTREEVTDSWIARQKARLMRREEFGEIKIPKGFFSRLSRMC